MNTPTDHICPACDLDRGDPRCFCESIQPLRDEDFDLFPTPASVLASRRSTDARLAHETNKRSW